MEYLKLDPIRNLKPRAKVLGWRLMRTFELLLDISATYDLRGRISKDYLDPEWLAAQWGMDDKTAKDLGGSNSKELVASWLYDLVAANRSMEEPIVSVDPNGALCIIGWDEFYGPKKTSTDRVAKHRAAREGDDAGADASGAQGLADLWNTEADPALPRVRGLSHQRLKMAAARSRERGLNDWKALIHKLNSIPGLLGKAGGKWRADFDWFIHPGNINKLEEGKYDGWGTQEAGREAPKLKAVGAGEDLYG